MFRSLFVAVLEVFGAVSVVVGAFLANPALGWVVAGGFTLTAAWRANQ